jgi:hypothetical protein
MRVDEEPVVVSVHRLLLYNDLASDGPETCSLQFAIYVGQ